MSSRAFAALGLGARRSAAAAVAAAAEARVAWVRAGTAAAASTGAGAASRAFGPAAGPAASGRSVCVASSVFSAGVGALRSAVPRVAAPARSFASRAPRRAFAPGGRARAERRAATALERRARDLPPELLPVVVLLGRPNVGKSALFNRLTSGHRLRGAGRRGALVRDTPGGHVTRDYRESPAALSDLRFLAVDTCGLEASAAPGSIAARSSLLTRDALERADVALLLLDARSGVTALDAELATWIRRRAPHLLETPGKLVVVANKAEGGDGPAAALQAEAELGLSDAVAVSATTGEGMADLFQKLAPVLDPILETRREQWTRELVGATAEADKGEGRGEVEDPGVGDAARRAPDDLAAESSAEPLDSSAASASLSGGRASPAALSAPVRLSIVGVPNSGKSTLVNTLLGSERCLTGPEPGLTRDAIQAVFERNGQRYLIADTAGWVRRARFAQHDRDGDGALTAASLQDREEALRHADVAVLVLDALRAAAAAPEEVERAAERARRAMRERAEALEDSLEKRARRQRGKEETGKRTGKTVPEGGDLAPGDADAEAPGLAPVAADAGAPALAPVAAEAEASASVLGSGASASASASALGSGASASASAPAPSPASARSSVRARSSSVAPPPLSEPPARPPLGISHRELTLAANAAQEGRAVVLAVNKLDALAPARRKEVLAAVRADADRSLRDLGDVPIVGISAVDERGLDALLGAVKDARDAWERRVPAAAVNAALADAKRDRARRGLGRGDAGTAALQRVKFAAMVNTRPPTFALSASGTDAPTDAEARMIANIFRKAFDLHGCPIRLKFRLNEKRKRKH